VKFVFVLMVAGAVTATAIPAAPAPGAVATAAVSSTAQALQNVRAAIGYDHLRTSGPGFTIGAAGPDGSVRKIQFGSRAGELRTADKFVYDGSLAWQFDARRKMWFPASLRSREKAAWPLWVRGHWWLNPKSGVVARIDPAQSSGGAIAVALSLPDGVVGATVFIDRTTWLPDRVVVPYEHGPFTQSYRDYRSVEGTRFAFEVETRYRDTSTQRVAEVTPLTSASDFARPRLPADFRFDPRGPAKLETRQGAPFSAATLGTSMSAPPSTMRVAAGGTSTPARIPRLSMNPLPTRSAWR